MIIFFWIDNTLRRYYASTPVPEASYAAIVDSKENAECYQRVETAWELISPSQLPVEFKAVLVLRGYKL